VTPGRCCSSNRRWVGCRIAVSTLLQYVDVERVFRFLHAVESQCRRQGVAVHARLAAGAHDEQTVGRLRHLFAETRRVASAAPEAPEAAEGASESAREGTREVAPDGGRERQGR
jgi:hypothetical protein